MIYRLVGILLIVFGFIIFGAVAYHNSLVRHQPIVFSERSMLDGLWNTHKNNYLDTGNGRTIDKSKNNLTTSEGESYTMLEAVWWDDKATFDQSWNWTKSTIQHTSGDHLFAWQYSDLGGGHFGINPNDGSNNSASDADTDIALALIFAHDRWNDNSYLDAAKQIIQDIWKNEVIVINGKPYLLANNIEKTENKNSLIIDPSYLAPYAYKIFANYDSQDNWTALADNSYDVLNTVSTASLDKNSSSGLPPDWAVVDRVTGKISASTNSILTTNFSFDAMRVPFRMALDWSWFGDSRAKQVLSNFSFLDKQWNDGHALFTTYAHDGSVIKNQEAPAIYGATIGYFINVDPKVAQDIYNQKLRVLYLPDTDSWIKPLSYYDDSWAWMGMALYNNFLVNLDHK